MAAAATMLMIDSSASESTATEPVSQYATSFASMTRTPTLSAISATRRIFGNCGSGAGSGMGAV